MERQVKVNFRGQLLIFFKSTNKVEMGCFKLARLRWDNSHP